MHTHAIIHLVKSNGWLNDYEEQKLGEQILQSQLDNVIITYGNNNNNNNTITQKQANNYLQKYGSYIDALHADKSAYLSPIIIAKIIKPISTGGSFKNCESTQQGLT